MSDSSLVKVEENNLVTVMTQRERQDLKLKAQLEFSERMGELGIYFAILTVDPELQTPEDAVIGIAANMPLESAKSLLETEVEFLQSGKSTLCNYQHIPPPSDALVA